MKVSTICLGTMTYGEQNTEQEGFEQMDFALDNLVLIFGIPLNYIQCLQEQKHSDIQSHNWKLVEKVKKEKKLFSQLKSQDQLGTI